MATTNNQYQIYVNSVLALARYIVVKSEDTATAVNNFLINTQGADAVDLSDETTWRYYMNLAGEYHVADTPMYVVSMDTLQTIEFTVANLAVHRATARAYAFGERQYLELVSLFPTQITLINGILNPVDINAAIAANDGAILTYPSTLIEFNEYTFVEKLQRWIDGYNVRWVNRAYTVSDNLYIPFTMGIMFALMPQAILSIRLEACKTNEAHSFHVRQYLLSHGLLDVYLDQLTTEQSLELYRNINYLERNAGQSEIFDWLVDHIMTERNLPLADYTMKHDISQMPASSYPAITFIRNPVNLGFNVDNINEITLDQMLEKEWPVARDNQKYQPDYEPVITEEMQNSLSNELPTKALESSMIDYTGSVPYPLQDTLLNHWLWLSSIGYYNTALQFVNPQTGESTPIFAKDAYALMWYAFNRSIGITLDQIPPMYAKRVVRLPGTTVAEMLTVVDQSIVGQTTIQEIHDLMPIVQPVQPVLSSDAFFALCQSLSDAANTQNDLVAYQEHMTRRAYCKNAMNLMWSDNLCYVADPDDNYTNWLSTRNINVGDWTIDDFGNLYLALVQTATGQDLTTTNSVAALQSAMIGMMKQLSSYSIQFMSTINASTIIPADWAAIRVGDVLGSQSNHEEATDLGIRALDQHPHFSNSVELQVTRFTPLHDIASQSNNVKWRLRNLVREAPLGNITSEFFNAARVRFRLDAGLHQNSRGIVPVSGIDQYLQLTLAQQQEITDIWGNDFYPSVPDTTPLSSVLLVTTLEGLVYVQPSSNPS